MLERDTERVEGPEDFLHARLHQTITGTNKSDGDLHRINYSQSWCFNKLL